MKLKHKRALIVGITSIVLFFCSMYNSYAAQYELPKDSYSGVFEFKYTKFFRSNIQGLVYKDSVYIPLKSLFEKLYIYYKFDFDKQLMSGYYKHNSNLYEMNFLEKTAKFKDSAYTIAPDEVLVSDLEVFVLPSFVNRIFNMMLEVDFSNLIVRVRYLSEKNLRNKNILPVLNRYNNEIEKQGLMDQQEFRGFDMLYDLERNLLNGGLLDYVVGSSFDEFNRSYNYSTNVGIQLLGGDLQVSSRGLYNEKIFEYDNLFSWRYFLGDNPFITQFQVGDIVNQGYSSNLLPINQIRGAQITNETTLRGQNFSTVVIEDNLKPGWQVELWVNSVLYDQTIADPFGNYRFELPLNYGNTNVELRVYGTRGEYIKTLRNIMVPSEFRKPGEVKYSATAGQRTFDNNFVADAKLAVGVNNWLTNIVDVQKVDNNEIQLFERLLVRLGSQLFANFDINPNNYYRAGLVGTDEDIGSFSAGYLLNDKRTVYGTGENSRLELAGSLHNLLDIPVSFSFRGARSFYDNYASNFIQVNTHFNLLFSFRVNYTANFTELDVPNNLRHKIGIDVNYFISDMYRIFPFLGNLNLYVNTIYDLNHHMFDNLGINLSQTVMGNNLLRFGYRKNFRINSSQFYAGLQLNFDKFRSSSRGFYRDDQASFVQTFSGALGFDSEDYELIANNSRAVGSVGQGAARFRFFLDDNANEVWDEGEQVIPGVRVALSQGGRFVRDDDPMTMTFTNLAPYGSYNVVVDEESFPNPLWIPNLTSFAFMSEPNIIKVMNIPCYSAGVIDGGVTYVEGDHRIPQTGVKVHIMSKDNNFKEVLPVYSDGTFYKVGLAPGEYVAWVDSAQVKILNVKSRPELLVFNVDKTIDGDFVEGLQFELHSQDAFLAKSEEVRTEETVVPEQKQEEIEETTVADLIEAPVPEPEVMIKKDSDKIVDKVDEDIAILANERKLFLYSKARSTKLSSDMKEYLDDVTKYLKAHPNSEISIVGHTDNFGALSETQSISDKRATAAVDYLVGKGIDKNRLLARGEGSRNPIASNTTPSGRKQNRRLELMVIE